MYDIWIIPPFLLCAYLIDVRYAATASAIVVAVGLTSSCLRMKDKLTYLTKTYKPLSHNHSATIPAFLDHKKKKIAFLILDLLDGCKS